MKRSEDYEMQKVTMNLRKGDVDKLRTLHGRLGASKVVRELIIGHIKRVEEIVAQNTPQLKLPLEDL
jgi:hypothetical protein